MNFPTFSLLSKNPIHHSNAQESIKFKEEILLPHTIKKRQDLSLGVDVGVQLENMNVKLQLPVIKII